MRRLTILVLALGMVLLAIPASASDCPRRSNLRGEAILDINDTSLGAFGSGSATVVYDGVTQNAVFAETGFTPYGGPGSPGIVTHVWSIGANDPVTFTEYSTPVDLGGGLFRFDSRVSVTSGGSGAVSYHGIFDANTGIGEFTVSGAICIDA